MRTIRLVPPPIAVLALVLALTGALGACGGASDGGAGGAAPTAAGAAATVPRGAATPAASVVPAAGGGTTAYGIAGLVPPHFPGSSADDWRTFTGALPGLGGWVGTYGAWTPQAGVPEIARSQAQVGAASGFRTIPLIGFHTAATGSGVTLTLRFGDEAQVTRFIDDIASFAARQHPPYLGVGNEMNLIWESDPAAFDAFAALLPRIAEAVHDASPQTKLFTTLQYEFLRGGGALSGRTRQPQWALLDRLTPGLDLVAFTTYPYFDYASPAEIPADYYAAGRQRAGIAVAFSEVGWPSAPIAGAESLPYGGTPEEQAAFVARLGELLAPVQPAFVMWAFAYDSPALGATFASLGLSSVDGTPHPALAAWQRMIGR